MSGADEIRWARRVRQDKIRRLYALDAKGILDEELIEDVGYAMYARCLSIQDATRAHFGRANCPRCRSEVTHTGGKEDVLSCACGWTTSWGDFHRTYKGRQLFGGNAYPVFKAFINRWPHARTPRDKLLEIDGLIHAMHVFQGRAGRPAACNLIEGSAHELVAFLDHLAYGDLSTPGMGANREHWREEISGAPHLAPILERDDGPEG